MENIVISNHTELTLQIMRLKADKFKQEEELRHTFREFIYTINPLSMVKESLHELATDKEVQFDLAKVGLNLGANFLIDRVMGRHSSIKGFLGSIIVEKISSSFLNNDNVSKIISGINKLIQNKPNRETN